MRLNTSTDSLPMKLLTALALASTFTLGGSLMAQKQNPLSAQDSDPQVMGWMQGFPPPADKVIRFTDPDYFTFPKLRWTVTHFRELMPTVAVDNGSQAARELPEALDPAIDAVTFKPMGSDTSMTWREAFDANYSDGVIVLHRGRIVYERYGGGLDKSTLHGAMSVTKSLTGLMAEKLVAEGKLDENALVGALIPELKESAFGDATVRQVMEMTTALKYSEDYADPKAEVWTYAEAGSPLPKPEGYEGPRSYFEFLQTVKKHGEHGDAFGYKTVNADVLGWLIARTTGVSVAEYFSNAIWSRIGAEREAFYTVDSLGTPFAGGGFNATLRDLSRLGLLILNDGRCGDVQVIQQDAIERIRKGGDPAAFAKAGYKTLPDWSYRGMWWVSHDDHGAYAARGVHGQTIWIDPAAEMVIVRFASHPVAANAANDLTSLPAYRAVANYLLQQDSTTQLVGPAWNIETIAGENVIKESRANLSFLPDGKLAGNMSVNRLLGEFTREESALSLIPSGSTMMLGSPEEMAQERTLLELLPKIQSFEIDESGTLHLKSADGVTITARRAK